MISLSRIDNRLLHGQVIEAWLPHLQARRVVVVDDVAASDELATSAFALVVPPSVDVAVWPENEVRFLEVAADEVPTLVLFRGVAQVSNARARGLPNGRLNVGNIHAAPGRAQVTRSVFLSQEEKNQLRHLEATGMDVVIQAVPAEKGIRLKDA
jgi:mannose/fructose/N-acetylgalactosamine-specific phosphotransferase system component IIB